MLRIVAFHGSPRAGGNSDILLQEVLKPIDKEGHEISLFRLNFMNIKPCQNCGECDDTGICVIGLKSIFSADPFQRGLKEGKVFYCLSAA
jgi:multimeric flavodoxin WrbA